MVLTAPGVDQDPRVVMVVFNDDTLKHTQRRSPLDRGLLAKALTQLDDPPVKALFVYNSNPVGIAPNQNAVRRGITRSDLFTVVVEQFMTDTARHADIVLPATTFLEHTDLYYAYGHYYLQVSNQAIEPLGEIACGEPVLRIGAAGDRNPVRERHSPTS